MRVGILGFGGMGHHHAAAITALKSDITVLSACDPAQERLDLAKKDFGAKTFLKARDFLADTELDFVMIGTPSVDHCRDVVMCLNAGKPAMTEKPACMSLAEYDKMLAAMKKTGVFFTVAHNRRWDNDYRTVCRVVKEGLLGDLLMYKTRVHGFHPLGGWRRFKNAGGGSLYDWGSHMIDQMVQLTGAKPRLVLADLRTMHDYGPDGADDFDHIYIKMDNGTTVIVELGGFWRVHEPRFHIIGTQGTLLCRHMHEAPEVWVEVKGRQAQINVPVEPGDWDLSFREIYPNLAQVLKGEAKLLITPESVRPTMQIIDAAFRSSKAGKAVSIR